MLGECVGARSTESKSGNKQHKTEEAGPEEAEPEAAGCEGGAHGKSIAGGRRLRAREVDLQIGGMGAEGNCAGRRRGVFCRWTAR